MQPTLPIALKYYGVKEVSGGVHNPIILDFFSEIGYSHKDHPWITDETAWCSAFANAVAKRSGREYSGKLNARSWLSVGQEIETPDIGDIVVFWRGSPTDWRGHVGFYISEDATHIYTLGGNQSNMVCIQPYPKKQLIGYRRLGVAG